jgi:crossover junction endodeoxyribonuclease RusA
MITFFIPGIPAPKGSRRHFVKKGKVVSVDANPKTRPWEMDVAWVTREKMSGVKAIEGPVGMNVVFQMPRLKSTPKTARWHTKKPDIDKLERALLDGLKLGGAYVDDSQVCRVDKYKRYAMPDATEIGAGPGVWVSIWEEQG